MSTDTTVHAPPLIAHLVPLARLVESKTNPRKYFDARQLSELAVSVKENGVLEPLIGRELNAETTEIVCGARRYRAAQLAGLTEVPILFRAFTDEEVRIVQLVENGQRADLSPIEEAETYAELVQSGLSVAAIAKKVGRDRRDIARRLPLANLPKRVKAALVAGILPVEHAELIARIPDAKLQDEALGRMLDEYGEDNVKAAVPYVVAKRIVEAEFMTALSLAVFDPEDAMLSPLGACSACAHLAGNNPDLFGDVKGAAVCTNPKDFRLKTENHLKRLRETGYTVLLTPKELKRAFPHGESDVLGAEFADLERTCPDDPKHRAYAELLGRGEKLNVVYAFKNGRVRRLYPAKQLKVALIAAGHAFAKDKKHAKRNDKPAGALSEATLAGIGRDAVSQALAVGLRSVKLTPSGWVDLLLRVVMLESQWKIETVIRRHGYTGSRQDFAEKRETILAERVKAMSDAEKRAFLLDCLIGDWSASADKAEQELYRHLLKQAGVDHVKVANRAIDEAKRRAAEAKPKPKPPIAAKTVRAPKPHATRR